MIWKAPPDDLLKGLEPGVHGVKSLSLTDEGDALPIGSQRYGGLGSECY